MSVLGVRGLSVAQKGTAILHDVALTVSAGDLYIIIGPNGAGKTTLIRTIAGVIKPRSGTIEILGRETRSFGARAFARAVAVVPQNPPSDSPFTVMETVLLGRAPHQGVLGLPSAHDERIARECMGLTDTLHVSDRRIDRLSGGERQRVAIARALCQEPALMLLDEPTASLDLAHQTRVMDLLERLRKERGLTVVMVSHDLNLAAMYGDRLLLLKQGKVLKSGSPTEVLDFGTLEQAYGCVLLSDKSPLGPFPRITLVPGRYLAKGK
jgi:iron complex transport system ATP-binding protein